MTTFDVDAIRARFPALSLTHDGQPMAFFDGPGGTQVPQSVIDAVTDYYRTSNANHGGAFATSERSDAIVEEAHAALADMLGVDADEITLGPNMTTLTFHISRSIAATMHPGDEIVVSGLDHQANVDPWIAAARDNEVIVRTWEPNLTDCTLRLEDLDPLLNDRTKLVAVGWASNAVGTINPVAEVARRAHAVGAWVYVDAVHAAPHLPLDARAIDADFVACSVYKFFGPHVGAVYGKRAIRDRLPAYKVRPAEDRFETGTGNFEGYAGALAAVEYIADVGRRYGGAAGGAPRRAAVIAGMGAIRAYELDLYRHLAARLGAIDGVTIVGLTADSDMERRTPTAAIRIAGVTPHEAATRLGEQGIAVWDGDFYATGLIERLGFAPDGVVRIGLTHYNTREEVDRLADKLVEIAEVLSQAFGGQSNVAPLREALLKAPGEAFGRAFDNPAYGFLHHCDLEVAKQEHAAFAELLTSLGTKVHLLDVEIDSPDLLYAYDPLIITDRGAIPLRPGKPNRVPEAAAIEGWTSAHGIPTAGRIEAPGTIEGGDTFWLRPDLFCIGRTLRTNQAGADQLAALVGGDVRVFDVPYWKGLAELVHLMSVISPIADDLAVVFTPLLPVGLWQLLNDLGYRLIDVPEEEYPTLGVNVLAVQPGVVIAAQGNPVTAAAMAAHGVEVHTYPAFEIGMNGSGGPTCMTRPILRG